MLNCKLCGFRCDLKTMLDSHIRTFHPYQHTDFVNISSVLPISSAFKDDDVVTDVQLPDIAAIISSDFSGGGGDFGGGGASGDY